jgi:hypothetical protein
MCVKRHALNMFKIYTEETMFFSRYSICVLVNSIVYELGCLSNLCLVTYT